jgi:arylsulfatase A-like enzyme
MTGRSPHTTGITANNIPLRATEECLPEATKTIFVESHLIF